MISTIERKRIYIFVAIAYSLSIAMGLVIFLRGGVYAPQANLLLTWTMIAPLIANAATRLITREGWSKTFLRPDLRDGRWRYYLAAWLLPLAAIIVGGMIYYLLFPGRFDPSMALAREQGMVASESASQPWKFFFTQMGIAILSPIPIVNPILLFAFGEEIGWRGYLLPKLLPLGSRKAILVVSAIWGAWHWPAILMGFNYGLEYWGAPVVGPLLFLLVLIFPSAFYAWVALSSGSVWPAAIAHSMNNVSGSIMFSFIRGALYPLLGPGVQGIIGSLGYALMGLVIFLSPRALDQPSSVPLDAGKSGNQKMAEITVQKTNPIITS